MTLFGDTIFVTRLLKWETLHWTYYHFYHADKLFSDLKIPEDLRVTLLRPYVNDNARLLVNRLDATRAADYMVLSNVI